MTLQTLAFITGAILVGIGLLGGGIELRELKVPSINRTSRFLAFFFGVAFIGLALVVGTKDRAEAVNDKRTPPPQTPVSNDRRWMSAWEYQQDFDTRASKGFYPSSIEGRCSDGTEEFRAVWKPSDYEFESNSFLTRDDYESKGKAESRKAFTLGFLNTFTDCNGVTRYQAVWLKRK